MTPLGNRHQAGVVVQPEEFDDESTSNTFHGNASGEPGNKVMANDSENAAHCYHTCSHRNTLFLAVEDMSFVDACYMATATVATVGWRRS